MAQIGSILVLPGDGIGQEVMRETRRVLDWFAKTQNLSFEIGEGVVGGASYDAHGVPLTDDTLARARAADAVLFGAIGGPQYDKLDYHLRPERGLLALRKELDLFANLRPALCFAPLAEASSLKTELVAGLDILIVRELTGGVYFGQPRGIETLADGQRRGINTQVYTTEEIRRVVRVAGDLAMKRGKTLCSVEKANVMESGVLWREEATWVIEKEFPGVSLSHMYADNCAMQLCRAPKQFDVIVTDNLFGDILSDEAAMLTGSLGMLPSASLGAADAHGKRNAMYEPIHGSAPDIAGQNKANPLACILSLAMAFRYSFNREDAASLTERAVERVLEKGVRTGDILQPGKMLVSTSGMGDAVIAALDELV